MSDTETDPDRKPDEPAPTDKVLKTFYTPIIILTAVFGAVFIFAPLAVRKFKNKEIIRCCILITTFCMWLLWVTIYISQMNPLVGPRISNKTAAWLAYKWGDPVKPLSVGEGGGGDEEDEGPP